jgi:rare lipoprotein A (peptidoglycan hydrolase)
LFPEKSAKIQSGTHILIWRAKKITIKEIGNTKQIYTLGKTVEQAIWENKDINLADDDIANPSRQTLVKDGMTISVTHVLVKEETKQTAIDYKTVSNEDKSLGWRVKKVTQAGKKGLREIRYKVVYHDDKEISRKILENDIVKNPTDEIVTQGTSVKTGKVHSGLGSWYAQPNHLKVKYPSITGFYAANYWLPKGSYVKVTNKANGKSIIVRINDAGPFGPNRIIDLDKTAFASIASLGAGIIDVKMEEVTN